MAIFSKAVILGGGGLAREMAALVRGCDFVVHGFIAPAYHSRIPPELRLGNDDVLASIDDDVVVVIGVGEPAIVRKLATQHAYRAQRWFPPLIDKQTEIDFLSIVVGDGTRICAGVRMTCDIEIGDFNLFNLNCTVGHDVRIGSYNVINPGVNISGGVQIGDGCLIGTGAQLLENVVIGDGATVGAGAVVTKDVPPGVTVAGVPAKPLEVRHAAS